MIDWAREESGARLRLGNQADELFQQVDQARANALQNAVQRWPVGSKPIGKPAPLPPLPLRAGSVSQVATLIGTLTFMSGAPLLFADARRDEQGNAILPPVEMDETKDNVHVHLKVQPKVTGSQMEAKVEITLSAEKNGRTYEEKSAGTLRTDLCPNALGEVPLEMTLSSSTALDGGGGEWTFTSQATAHVDDEANLSSVDLQTQAEMAVQPTHAGKAQGENPKYIALNIGLGFDRYHEKNSPITAKISATRWSSKVDPQFVTEAVRLLNTMSSFAVMFAYATAEKQWQDGYCVAVIVPDSGSARMVSPNSDTSFTANVRHKFEGKELTVPVMATLSSGQVSVTPSGSKVPAPATFRYKAPGKGGETATVKLESRSKRGVGKLEITFTTSAWEVDQPFGDGGHLSGPICALDKTFQLHYEHPVGLVGDFTFTPSGPGTGANSGTWRYEGVLKSGGVTNKGSGKYSVQGTGEGKPSIHMDPGTMVQTTFGYGDYTATTRPETLVLSPATCP